MDPALERLVLDPACHDDGNNLSGSAFGTFQDANQFGPGGLSTGPGLRGWCAPDNASFKKLMAQYGFALAPTAMHSARTTGFGGFHFSIEAAYTRIDDGGDTLVGGKRVQYWHAGTQGKVDVSSNKASVINGGPATMLAVYSAKLRKSFGFGLELTAAVGFMPQTSILTGGSDVRMSLLEGFRKDVPGILPDLAVGGGVRTITGEAQFQLTVVGLDAQLSKPLPIADSSIITPWIGYQYLWIFGDSGLIDLTPATDPIGYCNYAGQNVPGNPDPTKRNSATDVAKGAPAFKYDGQPVCRGGSPIDFNNDTVFSQARIERQRLIAGLNYRYEMVSFGIEFITDIVDPGSAQTGSETTTVPVAITPTPASGARFTTKKVTDKELLSDMPRQWSLIFELGSQF